MQDKIQWNKLSFISKSYQSQNCFAGLQRYPAERTATPKPGMSVYYTDTDGWQSRGCWEVLLAASIARQVIPVTAAGLE